MGHVIRKEELVQITMTGKIQSKKNERSTEANDVTVHPRRLRNEIKCMLNAERDRRTWKAMTTYAHDGNVTWGETIEAEQ